MKLSTALKAAPLAAVAGLAARDLTQKHHAVLRNYPVVGHLRYLLETIGPELRQYIVASNDEERPFTRDQRRWVYASAKLDNNYFGFGTDNDVEHTEGYTIIRHRTFSPIAAKTSDAHKPTEARVPSAKVLGEARGRVKAFRPASIVNISAMSYGSLSGNAVTALNKGAALAGCLHNTGYFGCRDSRGRFDIDRLKDQVESAPVRAIEVKLSQGAKPGLGGLLPGPKVTREIAAIRGIKEGEDCVSPSRHTEFSDVDSMLDWVETIATETGLPVGIKSAVGDMTFWERLVEEMAGGERGVDFVTVDGGEGGTGAAPLIFADTVALPFRAGFPRVYGLFAQAGLTDDVTFIGAGKLGLPDSAVVAMALGCDMVNVAREAMLAVGCVQAQKCHTGECPTGVATQNPWLERGLDPASKAVRTANYVKTLRRDLLRVSEACGVPHPGLVDADDIEILFAQRDSVPLRDLAGYQPTWARLGERLRDELLVVMSADEESDVDTESVTA